jgi:hypothetical protein
MRQIIFRGPAMHRITIDLVQSSITPIGLPPQKANSSFRHAHAKRRQRRAAKTTTELKLAA